ncbi:MAG TPA: glycosyltransferase family 39 protein, partial [Burkholderiales bacterium]|nr:glycosyltransferase family 39 protein [Burkholderiales bacterium]
MASNADILAFQGGLKGAPSDASPFKRPLALAAPPHAWLILIALAFALAWFGNIGYRKLVKADEGRYAEIPREMVASGDWLTPRLNGFKYFEKPALQYWATAAAFSVFGLHDWAARLWPALTGFLGVLLVWLIGNRAFGPPVGLASAAVLASSGIYAFVGHFLTLDMGVSVFMSATVLFCMMGQRDGTAPRAERNWMLAAWAAAALAMLSKGLIGIVLPGAAFAAYVLLARDWRRLARLHWLPGLALFLLIAAPWFIAVSLANQEFFHFFFIHEHFERFLTKQHGRYQPFWYFVPVLALGATPWLFSLAAGFANACKGKAVYVAPEVKLSRMRSFNSERFLALWCAVVFLFFSASDSKLGSYILPLFPAAALLTG